MSTGMEIEVLVAAMNQVDHTLPSRMNIRTDAIVGNQSDRNSVEEFEMCGHRIRYLSFAERGVGLNRNNALMRAHGDICLFADDDMVYCDDYVKTVIGAFKRIPDADVIIFNLIEREPTRYIIKKQMRVRWFNYLRYGTARIAVKLNRIREQGILFNLCFGGGTEHSHGEDNLFLTDCLRKGLKVYAVPDYIASLVDERDSTWNRGYNELYLKDQGVLYHTISRHFWKFLCFQDAIRKRALYERSVVNAYTVMISGVEE